MFNLFWREPLVGKASELLQALEKKRFACTDYLFPTNASTDKQIDIQSAWESALMSADIKDFRFHDFKGIAALLIWR